MSAGRMKGKALAGEVGDLGPAGPGEELLPPVHGLEVEDSCPCCIIVDTSGPVTWLKLLFLFGK